MLTNSEFSIERFSNDSRKTKTKALTPTNLTTGTNSAMNQSQFLATELPEN